MTEAVSDFEMGKIDTVVVGIGINYKTEDFPQDLEKRAGSVAMDTSVPRNRLAAAVINEFWEIYSHLTDRSFMKEYREYSNVIGKEIRFLEQGEWREGRALDIDDDGGLVVECLEEEGRKRVRVLHTGEITLRVRE